MTLTLSPEAETQLAAVAAMRGLPPEDALTELIAEARAASEREQQEALAGVRRSEADFAAGRSLSLEELRAHTDATLEAKRQEARQLGGAGMSAPSGPPNHVIRISEEARRQIDAGIVRIYDQAGEAAAIAWRDGIEQAIAGLAPLPLRCPVAPDNAAFQEFSASPPLRVFLCRPTRGRSVWRLLFTVHSATADDPPTVRVHQIRHSTQAPLSEWPDGGDGN